LTHREKQLQRPNRRQSIKTAAAIAAATATSGALPGAASADFAPIRSLPVITGRTVSYESDQKKRAIADYVANMKPFGGSLSCHGRHLLTQTPRFGSPFDFDILIIGSGYGASVCAARLAAAKRAETRLGIIERGREYIPGTFTDTFRKTTKESRFKLLGRNKNTVDNPVGLVNAMQNDEVNVLSGSGLGGSSLINASVAIRPEPAVFEQSCWPTALQNPLALDAYYGRAAWELGAEFEPIDQSPKAKAQRLAANRIAKFGAQFESAALAITRGKAGDGPIINRQGLRQRGCTDCGDCTAGCNVGAKNTLTMNYLPLAKSCGAEMYTHTEVIRIEKLGVGYRLHFKTFLPGRGSEFKAVCGSVTSRVVIVGAGSIGSNEILLRSQGCGMELSSRVGHKWTMNGDALGFVRQSEFLTNIAARGAYDADTCLTGPCKSGPTIQTNVTFPNRPNLKDRTLIQDGTVSRAYANILGLLMQDMDFDQTLVMLGMGHDGADGRVVLREDGLGSVKWPGLMDSPYRKRIRSDFAKVAQGHGGKYKYLKIFGDNFITVHPLGGCAMADSADCGVVDDLGRVFDVRPQQSLDPGLLSSSPVHQGLYVADGSVIPTSIGCNPLLTISALAERIAAGIVEEPGLSDLFA
jgi:cholesterol oxidase